MARGGRGAATVSRPIPRKPARTDRSSRLTTPGATGSAPLIGRLLGPLDDREVAGPAGDNGPKYTIGEPIPELEAANSAGDLWTGSLDTALTVAKGDEYRSP